MTPTLRTAILDLYHRRGKTAAYVARSLDLPREAVFEALGIPPLEEWRRQGRRVQPETPRLEAPRPRPERSGCGCREATLCAAHRERLERARRAC